MNLTFFESLMMGFVSGLAEILPISAPAHRGFLRLCFGAEGNSPLFLLLCHVAVLSVVAFSMRQDLFFLSRANRLMKGSRRRRHQQADYATACTVRHLRGAMLVTAVTRILTSQLGFVAERLYLLCGTLLWAGALLYLPGISRSGNKDGRNMAKIDSLLMGLAAGFGAVPGFSALGAAVSVGLLRGVERVYALRFSLVLLMGSLGVDVLLDFLTLIGKGPALGMAGFWGAMAGAALCALGAWIGMKIVQAQSRSTGFAIWSYYLWGMAIVCFALFLIL